jgi:hypothetical protein
MEIGTEDQVEIKYRDRDRGSRSSIPILHLDAHPLQSLSPDPLPQS